jgi:hypothetical protein
VEREGSSAGLGSVSGSERRTTGGGGSSSRIREKASRSGDGRQTSTQRGIEGRESGEGACGSRQARRAPEKGVEESRLDGGQR